MIINLSLYIGKNNDYFSTIVKTAKKFLKFQR